MDHPTLWTACVTPFNQAGSEIDFKSLAKVLSLQEDMAVGALLLGSTGEGLSLTAKEQRKFLKFVFKLGLSIPVMVGVPSSNFIQALEWVEFCGDFPISHLLLTTPLYTKPGPKGQTQWLECLMNKANVPVMLYNVPSRTGVSLSVEAVKNLSGHENFWAIKDSSGGLDMSRAYREAAPQVTLYCGDDHMMPAMAAIGAKGLVSVASNIWPKAMRKYVTLILEGKDIDIEGGAGCFNAFYTATNPIPVKVLMHALGMITYPTPRLPLSLQDLPSLAPLEEAHLKITKWAEGGARLS